MFYHVAHKVLLSASVFHIFLHKLWTYCTAVRMKKILLFREENCCPLDGESDRDWLARSSWGDFHLCAIDLREFSLTSFSTRAMSAHRRRRYCPRDGGKYLFVYEQLLWTWCANTIRLCDRHSFYFQIQTRGAWSVLAERERHEGHRSGGERIGYRWVSWIKRVCAILYAQYYDVWAQFSSWKIVSPVAWAKTNIFNFVRNNILFNIYKNIIIQILNIGPLKTNNVIHFFSMDLIRDEFFLLRFSIVFSHIWTYFAYFESWSICLKLDKNKSTACLWTYS